MSLHSKNDDDSSNQKSNIEKDQKITNVTQQIQILRSSTGKNDEKKEYSVEILDVPSDLENTIDSSEDEVLTSQLSELKSDKTNSRIFSNKLVVGLLDEYIKFIPDLEDRKIIKKEAFIEIAKNLQKIYPNVRINGSICEKKFRNMKHTYRVVLRNFKENNKIISWPYFAKMDEILQEQLYGNNRMYNSPRLKRRKTSYDYEYYDESDDDNYQNSHIDTLLQQKRQHSDSDMADTVFDFQGTPKWFKNFLIMDKEFKVSIQKSLSDLKTIFQRNLLEQQRKSDLISKLLDIMK